MSDGAARAAATVFDLSKRAKLRLSGADALRFLNGQITNDVRKAGEGQAIHAAVLNAKGRMNADVFIRRRGDDLLVDTDPELRERLAERLDRYIIADDVQVEDVTETFGILHVIGTRLEELTQFGEVASADRFGITGYEIWASPASTPAVVPQLAATSHICDDDCAESFRVERGIPRWGYELSDEIIPVEANLEEAAIDYAKGCYIGQEVISRMKMSGQRNKRLCGLVSVPDVPLHRGMRLLPGEGDERDVGSITSATRSVNLQKEIALGFVKRGYNSTGMRLRACDSEAGDSMATVAVEIVDLPFI